MTTEDFTPPEEPAPLSFTIARADLVASAAFFVIGAILAFEGVRLGAGWGDNGPDAGFFPFWLAIVMTLGGLFSGLQAYLSHDRQPFFEYRAEVVELVRVGLPLAAAIAMVPILGLYLVTAIYLGLFAWWYGQFRWHTSLLTGGIAAALIYLVLTRGFRLPMPQSIWYGPGFPL